MKRIMQYIDKCISTKGFTIVEMLIASMLTLLVGAIAGKALITSTVNVNASTTRSYNQKNARIALQYIAKDLTAAESINNPITGVPATHRIEISGLDQKDIEMVATAGNQAVYEPDDDVQGPWHKNKEVIVYGNGIPLNSGYTIDYDAGTINFDGVPGAIITADFTYDIDIEYVLEGSRLRRVITDNADNTIRILEVANGILNNDIFERVSANLFNVQLDFEEFSISTVLNNLSGSYVLNESASLPPLARDLTSIFFTDRNTGWAIDSGSNILRFNGSSWVVSAADLSSENLNGLYFLDDGTGWAVGNFGLIYYYDGSDWTQQTSNTTDNLQDIYAEDFNEVTAVGGTTTGVASIETFDGTTWTAETTSSGSYPINSITGFGNYAFAAANSGEMYDLENSLAWQVAYDSSSSKLYSSEEHDGELYIGGDDKVYVYDEEDNSWRIAYTNAGCSFMSLKSYDGELYAGANCSGSGDIYKMDDGSWDLEISTTEQSINALEEFEGELYAAGQGSGTSARIYMLDDSWSSQVVDSSINAYYAFEEFDDQLFVSGDGGKVLSFDGDDWRTSYDSTETQIKALGVFSGNLYAGSSTSGKVFRFNTSSWSELYDTSMTSIESFAEYDSRLYAGGNGRVLEYGGSSWSAVFEGSDTFYSMIEYDGRLFGATGYNGKVYVYNHDAISSVNMGSATVTENLNDLNMLPDADCGYQIWAVGNNGTILRYGYDESTGFCGWEDKTSTNTQTSKQNLNAVFFFDENTGWAVGDVGTAVGDVGTILKYDVETDQWLEIPSGVTEDLNEVFLFSKDDGYIVGDNATLLRIGSFKI